MVSPVLPNIHILYENPAWIPPLQEGLENEGFQVRLFHVNEGSIDPSKAPEDRHLDQSHQPILAHSGQYLHRGAGPAAPFLVGVPRLSSR